MKKIILIFMFVFVPILAYSAIIPKVEYVNIDYNFDWDTFVYNNKYDGGSGKRKWKYGYEKSNKEVLPKEPPNFKIPEYLKKHRLISGDAITLENIRSKLYSKKDAIQFIKFNKGYLGVYGYVMSDGQTLGITKDGIYFPVLESEPSSPFKHLVNSFILTIQNRCVSENREPTISEKYLLLYFCCIDINSLDNSYYSLNQSKLERTWFAEQILGTIKIFIICGVVLFVMILPALVILFIKRITPEGSALHKAASLVEWVIIIVGGATLLRSLTKK